MPQFLQDLLKSGYNGVKGVEPKKDTTLIDAELDKKNPRINLYTHLPELYSTSLPIIESQGSIDPARTLAVNSTKYINNDKGGRSVVGALNLGNLMGGSANRPSDTIFKSGPIPGGPVSIFERPVSKDGQPINDDWSGLKYAVEKDVDYSVSHQPAGSNILTGIVKGTPQDIASKAIGAAIGGIKKVGRELVVKGLTSKRKKAVDKLKKPQEVKELQYTGIKAFPIFQDKLETSNFYKTSTDKFKHKKTENINKWNDINDKLLGDFTADNKAIEELIKLNEKTSLTYIKIKQEGYGQNYLLFPAAIGDISEDINPEWNSHKYVGSPFNVYRYSGVERSLKISFKVYYFERNGGTMMKLKLNRLRELAFPNRYINKIQIGTDGDYEPIVFTPNLIQLSIGDLYSNLKGFVSNLSISVPQNVSWANSNPDFAKIKSFVYPTMVDVSFDMKITENHSINVDDETITYRFTDMDEFDIKKQDLKKPNEQIDKSLIPKTDPPKKYIPGLLKENGYLNQIGPKGEFRDSSPGLGAGNITDPQSPFVNK
jgi:hypothetical protein